jgi:aryl carrier-like protein
LDDGNIEFLGRLDHQVKIRGYRVELEEVEAVLRLHPSVCEAVVVEREDVPGDKRLVAYIVTERHCSFSPGDVRHLLRERLPDYMVPSAFVLLDALPLTPSGKVDRRALPTPPKPTPESEESFVAPRNGVESVLAEICAETLRVEHVGVYDNFLELGGDSLLATRVLSRMREALGVQVSLRSLFSSPTVAGLAEAYEKAKKNGGELMATRIRPLPRKQRRIKTCPQQPPE